MRSKYATLTGIKFVLKDWGLLEWNKTFDTFFWNCWNGIPFFKYGELIDCRQRIYVKKDQLNLLNMNKNVG
jgi:hypothetical protein